MNIWTIDEEASALRKRFMGVNRAGFARNNSVKGGQAMIYQHITGRRPISLEAAMVYAAGFRCALEEISPRLAMESQKAAALSSNQVAAALAPAAAPWPFSSLTPEQWSMLTERQRGRVEGYAWGFLQEQEALAVKSTASARAA